MKKWSINRKVTFYILFIGVVILVGVCIFNKGGNVEKKVIKGEGMWPFHSFESAIDEATTIVYGRVVDKSGTKVHETANVNGKSYYELYKEVSIEVIDILKGKTDNSLVTYLEFGGETEEVIYVFEDIKPVKINSEYIFFLNKHGAALSPMTLLPVENGTVLGQGKIMPTSETGMPSSDISVESYLGAIESVLVE